jgi:uncharacterized protein (TIGR02594 family)
MISRRALISGLMTCPMFLAAGQNDDEPIYELTYPPFDALTNPETFGYKTASEEEKEKARDIINGTPSGPRPIEVAQSFVDRLYIRDPRAISQWPAPESWNPLIVEFFRATSTPTNNDMIPWCAAFANWCLKRAGRNGSQSASSQSFLSKYFKRIKEPQAGDLAIFTCYDKSTKESLGIGHVAFFIEKLTGNRIRVVGGNQSQDGHYSIISDSECITIDREVRRKIHGKYVPCVMRLNTYVSV